MKKKLSPLSISSCVTEASCSESECSDIFVDKFTECSKVPSEDNLFNVL